MKCKWNKCKLGDIVEINSKTYSAKENWKYVNYLDTGNITENKIDSIKYIDSWPLTALGKIDRNKLKRIE